MESDQDFHPRPQSKYFHLYGNWEAMLIVLILIVPTVGVLYILLQKSILVGVLSAAFWLPALTMILRHFHRVGIIRLWLSVPIMVIASVVFALSFAV